MATAPDVMIAPTISDFLAGRDPVLEKAVGWSVKRATQLAPVPIWGFLGALLILGQLITVYRFESFMR